MHAINPRKLLNSKWTATSPKDRQKHFAVCTVEFDDDGRVIVCEIEAVLTRRTYAMDWRELKNPEHWLQGWK
ncbi:MAG: TIGR02450 family Trp-rich protein [Lysobacterales bacterium]